MSDNKQGPARRRRHWLGGLLVIGFCFVLRAVVKLGGKKEEKGDEKEEKGDEKDTV